MRSCHDGEPFISMMALMLALVILLTTCEDAEDRVYEGELLGDLEAEGYIWGEQKASTIMFHSGLAT